MKRSQLQSYLSDIFQEHLYQDYGPNGLQIEGREEIKRISFAVSATKETIEKAIKFKSDALIVHHGLFWKFHGVRTLTESFGGRVLPLVRAEINLFGYHLPLDGHQELGNAASLANLIGLQELNAFGEHKGISTGVSGRFKSPIEADKLRLKLKKILGHEVIHSAPNKNKIHTMGIITGGANSNWIEAQQKGLDAYLTGEISEHDWHEAKEGGVHFFAGGHHATEQFGIQNLMRKIEKDFKGVKCQYINVDNPA